MIPGRRWSGAVPQARVEFPQAMAATRCCDAAAGMAAIRQRSNGLRPATAGISVGRAGTSRTGAVGHSGGLVLVGVLLVLIVAVLPEPGNAQSSASYQIPRQAIAAGAGPASSASFSVSGTMGQPGASATSTSASYTLSGGFHRAAAAAPPPDALFANGFESP